MKTIPLGATTPVRGTVPTAPVFRLIVPRELTGYLGGTGQTVGPLLALHGATAVYAVPGRKGPVMTSTVSAVRVALPQDMIKPFVGVPVVCPIGRSSG
jgi:hypothetical protein